MRDFDVHFSFYSEERGRFDDVSYPVTAETLFDARKKAWLACDQDKDTRFRSCIRQYAVTWSPNLLDAGDYFYSRAAETKQSLGFLNHVLVPNDCISKNEYKYQHDADQSYYMGVLQTLDNTARDLFADKGIVPPSIYEELHYAEKLCENLNWEKANALWEQLELAQKWNMSSVYSIRNLFEDGHTLLRGEMVAFHEHFGRNGIYPLRNKLLEHKHTYISRWKNMEKVNCLKKLTFFPETDIIANSIDHMDCKYQVLLLKCQLLNEGYRTPENQLWLACDPLDQSEVIKDGMLLVENFITGQRMICNKDAFLGVLRPDIIATLDMEALKKEYFVNIGESDAARRTDFNFDENEDELEQ